MTDFAPTPEQEAAVELFRRGGTMAIEAGAGAGKTSTLRLLADAAGRRRVQYVAFNRSIVQEARAKMPRNTYSSTAHGLAYKAVGHRFDHRFRVGRMRSMDIARRLDLGPIVLTVENLGRRVLQPAYLGGLVLRSVTRFCQSADLTIGPEHVPYIEGIDFPQVTETGLRRTYVNNELVRATIAPALAAAWADVTDEAGSLPYRHDHYLKLWHLSDPHIAAEVILFDEAQDANPVMAAIVAAQEHAQRVYVGDSQQAIYEFTGAVNAMANIDAAHRTYLTASFRFGPAVADVANEVLARLDAELRITGAGPLSVLGPIAQPDAVLTRTNAEAVRQVLDAQRRELNPHLVGGGVEVLSFARAARDLMEGRPTDHPELACFDTWGEVEEYVTQDEQGDELRLLVDLVNEFGVDTIEAALGNMPTEEAADVVVSTAHKAKGREWDAVTLAGDFPDEEERREQGRPIEPAEWRLLYVAATRARRELDVDAVPTIARAVMPDPADGEPDEEHHELRILTSDHLPPETFLLVDEAAIAEAAKLAQHELGACCLHGPLAGHEGGVCCLHPSTAPSSAPT